MDTTTNPYAQWLGLTDVENRPDHYTLLGLNKFESDAAAIKMAADRATARVRSFRPGSQARQWAQLLDEISEARNCLLDDESRAAYDEQVRNGSTGGGDTNADVASSPNPMSPVNASSDNAPSSSSPMYPPSAGPAPMPEQPRYGPAGPAPDDAQPTPAANPVKTGDGSLFAPGYSSSASSDGGSGNGNQPHATPVATPSGQSPGPIPMGRSKEQGAQSGPTDDPMAPVSFGASNAASPSMNSPMPSSGDPMAPVAPMGPYAPSAANYGQDASQHTATAQPAGDVDPMAPMAMPVGSGHTDAPDSPSPTAAANTPIPLGSPAPKPEDAAAIATEDKSPRKGRGQGLVYFGAAAAIVLATGIVGLLMFPPGGGNEVAEGPVDNGNHVSTPDEKEPEPEPEPTPEDEPAPEITPQPEPEPEPGPSVINVPDPNELPIEPEPEPTPEPTPEPEPELQPLDEPEDDPAMSLPDTGGIGPPIVTPIDPEPVPQPEPEPDPSPEPLTPAEKEALKKALVGARTAMGERDQAAVIENLAAAKALARTDEQKAMVKRLEELNHYVKEFWSSVDEAYINLQPSTTIPIGTAEAAIVEVTPQELTLRYFGRNKTIPRNDMPSGLAMAIANTWFTNDPANKVVKGALQFVDPNGRKDEARRLWQEAQAAGVDVAPLMPVLDDTYDF